MIIIEIVEAQGNNISGYFNPLHKGHIDLFHRAEKGRKIVVIVNNDIQRALKQSKKFMDESERLLIINELNITDSVYLSIDGDLTVSKTLEKINEECGDNFELYFANGGDQNNKVFQNPIFVKNLV